MASYYGEMFPFSIRKHYQTLFLRTFPTEMRREMRENNFKPLINRLYGSCFHLFPYLGGDHSSVAELKGCLLAHPKLWPAECFSCKWW